jgi:protein-L-isoaspartate O-methyltransferase
MMFRGNTLFNASFDIFANAYHSVRPGYPEQLFADIRMQCDIDERSRVLEIGAGSGIATVKLAEYGCPVVAIEPGGHLAEIARQQTAKYRNVEVRETTFEGLEPTEAFNAVMAFTAFHWLSEASKYEKVARLLSPAGNLVLVWNSFFQCDSPATAATNKACAEFLPEVYSDASTAAEVNQGVLAKLSRREQEIGENSLFNKVFLRRYLTRYNYDADTYPKLLNTYPKVIAVEDSRRKAFLSRLSDIIREHRTISVPVLTSVIVCKVRESLLEMIAAPGPANR